VRAAEDRPVSRRAYFPLNVCISGTAESTGAIFIPCSPPSFRLCDGRTDPNHLFESAWTVPRRRVSGSLRRPARTQLLRQSRSSRCLTSSPVVNLADRGSGGMICDTNTNDPDFGAAGESGGRLAGRSTALTTGPVPGPVRAAEDRPVSRRAYFVLYTCRSGTTESMGAIFILAHPLPHVVPGLVPRTTGEGKDFLNAGTLVNANHARATARTYARTFLTIFDRPDRRSRHEARGAKAGTEAG
jgi:hypothetical protein